MPHIVIDSQHIEAQPGKTVLQAALENGINIPHFCWHPELSISGNCRMCLVEVGMPKRQPDGSFLKNDMGEPDIGYFPKLQVACATFVSDGLHIRTQTEPVVKAQESVMEFILINHPLDCPICDEAGQCKLQEYAFNQGNGESRFEEMKNRAKKRVSWGPNVLYDAERCISCSRCIRFAKEIAKQDVLTFVNRGDHVTIELFPETVFDSPYSMNVIDICPVGALTSKDFRFKSRVWDMSFNDSICPTDSTGANIKLGVRNNKILRIDPRTNMHVNKYWITDYCRLNAYEFVNENRVLEPLMKKDEQLQQVSWDEAYKKAAEELKKFKPDEIMFLASAKATNEDNYIAKKFATEVLKTKNIDFLYHIDKSFEDGLLGVSDRTPNSKGVEELNIKSSADSYKAEQIPELIKSGKIKALYVMEEDFAEHKELLSSFSKLELLIVHAYNHSEITKMADIVFATSTYAEIEGTFTNKEKRVQHFTPALVTKENLHRMGMKLGRLDKFGSHNDRWTEKEIRNCRQSWRTILNLAKLMGAKWNYKNSEDIFNEITEKIESFKGMSYELLDEFMGMTLGETDKPEEKVFHYESHFMKPY